MAKPKASPSLLYEIRWNILLIAMAIAGIVAMVYNSIPKPEPGLVVGQVLEHRLTQQKGIYVNKKPGYWIETKNTKGDIIHLKYTKAWKPK